MGVMNEDFELQYLAPEEYLASPMPYVDESDEEAVADEMKERKQTAAMQLSVCENGLMYMLMPLPEGVTKEEVDAAVEAGEIILIDGCMSQAPMKWEERDGAFWIDTGIEGEVLGEAADSWAGASDENGNINFMNFRFVKAE